MKAFQVWFTLIDSLYFIYLNTAKSHQTVVSRFLVSEHQVLKYTGVCKCFEPPPISLKITMKSGSLEAKYNLIEQPFSRLPEGIKKNTHQALTPRLWVSDSGWTAPRPSITAYLWIRQTPSLTPQNYGVSLYYYYSLFESVLWGAFHNMLTWTSKAQVCSDPMCMITYM